ncbi:hypothetical protein K438DRAFT_1751176 [Mycena galopus ATCC 62051]|nr:hypothetical protein K438DRAFT_1751176 [Mycena galopus ATCC 62051]
MAAAALTVLGCATLPSGLGSASGTPELGCCRVRPSRAFVEVLSHIYRGYLTAGKAGNKFRYSPVANHRWHHGNLPVAILGQGRWELRLGEEVPVYGHECDMRRRSSKKGGKETDGGKMVAEGANTSLAQLKL